ncbi:MAG: aminotransferase class I/II-fold pyridoxal phosphate-dependent enzyme [Candidatus Hodarchaeota archaeon]
MDLFDKCKVFQQKVEYVKGKNQFFYLREVDPAASPVVTRKGKNMIMLGSNNYLGLTDHPKVKEAAIKAIEEYGTGACSSRILTGTTSLHTKLERKLAEFKGTEAATLFSTGFMTMAGTITAITQKGDYILSDELNHASIIDGCSLSKAEVRVYRHSDMADLEQKLASCPTEAAKLIVTDGVFSMKGVIANLPEIKKLAERYGARIMVDDAHCTGVLGAHGRGTLEYFHMEGQIDLVCATFSKAFGTIGGFTGAKKEVITFLQLNARTFVFTASPPPSVVATVLAAIEVLEEHPELVQKLHVNARFIKEGLSQLGYRLEDTKTPIIPILIGDDEMAFKMTGQLEEEGVIVNPVVPPAVSKESSLIRVTIMATHTQENLTQAIDKFRMIGKRLGII